MEAAASGKCPVATTLQMAGSVSGRGCSVEPWQLVAIVTDAPIPALCALVNHPYTQLGGGGGGGVPAVHCSTALALFI